MYNGSIYDVSTSIKRVKIWKRVTSIGTENNGVEKICAKAFCGCLRLQKADIPAGSKRIGAGAFQACENLTEVIINKGVKIIGTGAFIDCTKLNALEAVFTSKK